MNSKSEWAPSLLYHYAGRLGEVMDKKYKTYNWNIEVNLQEEALRFEAIRECCLSDSKDKGLRLSGLSGDEMNLSSEDAGPNKDREVYVRPLDVTYDPFNGGAAAIDKDGSMVLMKNTNLQPA